MDFIVGCMLGSVIGTVVTIIMKRQIHIGTIHIEYDRENSGEKYIFSFDNFDGLRTKKSGIVDIVDHTQK